MGKIKKSFSAKLSLNILLYTAILFLLTQGIVTIISYNLILREAKSSASNLLSANVNKIENVINKIELSVQNEAWLVSENRFDEDFLYHITQKVVSENENIVGSAIAFRDGYFKDRHFFSPYSYIDRDSGGIVSKQLGTDQYDYFEMNWFAEPYKSRKPYWSEPYFDIGGGYYRMCTYSYPLCDENGEVYAVITADITLQWLGDVVDKIHPYKNSYAVLFSENGTYLNVGDNPSLVGETIFSFIEKLEVYDYGKGMVESFLRGDNCLMSYKSKYSKGFVAFGSMANGWHLSIIYDLDDVMESAYELNWLVLLVLLFSLALLTALCYVIVSSRTKALSSFSQSARLIAKGNFKTKLPEIKSEDEIRQLRDSFDYMQTSLCEYIDELKKTTAANERMESELSIATSIQEGMLSHDFPVTDNASMYALLKPAREVGGDLYDFMLKDNLLYFAIGDVSGKGVPAAIYMAIARAALHLFSGIGFPQALARASVVLDEGNRSDMFVTLLIAKLNLDTGELTYCNAGHNPMVLVDKDGKASFVETEPNLALGVFPDFQYHEQTIMLQHGTRLILYTDGVNEAEQADGSQFGNDRLLKYASDSRKLNCKDTADGLLAELSNFAQGNPQNDDITIMTVDYK